MVLCRNWEANGTCRFGDRCRFDHPQAERGTPFLNIQNANRFGSQNNAPPRNNNYNNQNRQIVPELPYHLDKEAIRVDLTEETPQWILSCYGPGRAPPRLLWGEEREQSFEEMRLRHYDAEAAGNPQQALEQAAAAWQAAIIQMQEAASDIDAAVQFIISGEHQHPNRIDIVAQSASQQGAVPNPFNRTASPFAAVPTANLFGAPSQPDPSSGAFGQPSSLGARSNPFASPAPAFGTPIQPSPFGQPSNLGGGAFGQPSPSISSAPFGQPSVVQASPFGQPSNLGQTPSPFGAPSNTPQPAPFSAFNNTSAHFQQLQALSPFANNVQPTQSTPFRQSGVFGAQPTQAPNPFNNVNSAPFGAPSPARPNSFGASPQPQAPTNPFGAANPVQAPSPFGQAPAISPAPSPFGAQPTNTVPAPSPFGQVQQAAPKPFGNTQAQPPAPSNAFGQPTQLTTGAPSPFSQPTQPVAASIQSTFGSGSNNAQPTANNFAIPPGGRDLDAPQPSIFNYSTKDNSGNIVSFKGQRVVFEERKPGLRRPDGKWQKIMFPDGPPAPNRDTALQLESYEGNDALKAAYQYSAQHGVFKDGKIPLIPPLQQWCSFDF